MCHPRALRRLLVAVLALAIAAPLAAQGGRESLGMFDDWGAFRDPQVPRCYAISTAQRASGRSSGTYEAYADVATWPRRDVRGQVHFRLSRELAERARITLSLGGERHVLTGGGVDAWAADRRMDAAVVSAMRSAGSMSVSATDRYSLEGVATAMDAATVGCARIR